MRMTSRASQEIQNITPLTHLTQTLRAHQNPLLMHPYILVKKRMDRLISWLSSYVLLSVLVCSFLEDPRWTEAFLLHRRPPAAPTLVPSARSSSCSGQQHHILFMGKGLNKAKNKQAALKQKLEEAKRKKLQEAGSADDTNAKELQKLSDEEIQERNDRLRFEELLKKGSANVFNDYSSGGYLNKQQEEEEIDAYRKCVRCSATALIESSYQVLKQIKKY